ncbi:hypothetical protein PM082_023661 [Marasmius tenuissimus]|nr:hypothetical protein PM082_023661 [Marasmius tenuissimus]
MTCLSPCIPQPSHLSYIHSWAIHSLGHIYIFRPRLSFTRGSIHTDRIPCRSVPMRKSSSRALQMPLGRCQVGCAKGDSPDQGVFSSIYSCSCSDTDENTANRFFRLRHCIFSSEVHAHVY